MNMALKTNRELTNEMASSKKFIPDVESQDFMRERTQTIKSISTNSNLIGNTNNFDFTDVKTEEKFMYEYHHWGAHKKVMDFINIRDYESRISSVGGKMIGDNKTRKPSVRIRQ